MTSRHDFYDMDLWRDGVKVEPLRRNRVLVSIYFNNGWTDAKDTAMAGVYSFPPEAFKPGGKLELKVPREFNPEKWETFKISEVQGTTLYNQFSGCWKYAETADAQPHFSPLRIWRTSVLDCGDGTLPPCVRWPSLKSGQRFRRGVALTGIHM